MDIEETEEEATTAVTPQQIQDNITNGLAYIQKATSPYPAMVKKYGADWKQWPQTSNWYKGLQLLHLAHDQALLCVYSNYGVSAYNK